jgi:hypothetical protein
MFKKIQTSRSAGNIFLKKKIRLKNALFRPVFQASPKKMNKLSSSAQFFTMKIVSKEKIIYGMRKVSPRAF